MLTTKRGICLIAIMVCTSCKNVPTKIEQLPQKEYAQPIIQPFKFSKFKKIDWAAVKAIRVQPAVKKFGLDKLPIQFYDTVGFKTFTYPVEETKFDYAALPEKDFDIDKLSSKPLKFKTYMLPPPKLIKALPPRVINENLSLYEFGEAQKLSGTYFLCSLTDHDGFVWIVTDKGLYRYDGENLLLYVAGTFDHLVNNMVQDNVGRIWMSTSDGGIEVLDPKSGTLRETIADREFPGNNISQMKIDKQQNIWLTILTGDVNIIDTKLLTVKYLDKKQCLFANERITGVTQDKTNRIWIASAGGGLRIIDIKNKKIKRLDKAHGLKSDTVGMLFCDRAGRVWTKLPHGDINVLDAKSNKVQYIKGPYANNIIQGFFEDNKGKIWISTSKNGLLIIDPEKHSIVHMDTNNGLSYNDVLNINQDMQGQVWVCAYYGINIISNCTGIIKHIGKDYISGLMEDRDGFIWQIRYPGGLDILDRQNETIRHLSGKLGLAGDSINCYKMTNDTVLIGTNRGLYIIDRAKKTVTHLGKEQGISNSINAVTDDRTGLIWIGTWGDGLFVYNPNNKTIKHIAKSQGLNDGFIEEIITGKNDDVWVNTENGGLNIINTETGIVYYLSKESGLMGSITQLLDDNKGNVWIGTDKGIYIIDRSFRLMRSFSTLQGLISEEIMSLIQYKGSIYAGTNKGVTRITPPVSGINCPGNWQIASFGTAYGLVKLEANNYQSDLITKDGLYWWGDQGITVTDLSKKDAFVPPVFITGINVMDKPAYFTDTSKLNLSPTDALWIQNKSGYYLRGEMPVNAGYVLQSGLNGESVKGPYNIPVNLHLRYDQNFIQFHYGNINLVRHDTAIYRYILIGADKNWSDESSLTSSVNYINLQPGKYTFEVSSRNINNLWAAPSKFSFTIDPPWWQTWWAYLAYTGASAGIIWCFVYFRSLQLIKQKRVLERKVHLRTEEVMQQKEEIESQRDSLEIQRNDLEKTLDKLKTTQTQLIQSEKMASLGELTAGIAHEIQNPLNFVNNFSEINQEMLDELDEELNKGDIAEAKAIAADIRQNEQKINHHGKRADGIVKGMLEHSRSRSGQKEPTDINTLADEFMRLSYHGLRSKDKSFNSEMVTTFDKNLPKINVVQQDIGRVLLNLFNNAFYAVNQKLKTADPDYKPEVIVSTSTENGAVIIKVKDNGVGIPDAIKDKIMQPFFTTKPTGQGTGLGLSLSYDIVAKGHGGKIDVATKEGESSEFTIYLPII